LTGASRPEWSNTWPQKLCLTRPRKCTVNMHARYMAMMIQVIISVIPSFSVGIQGAASPRRHG